MFSISLYNTITAKKELLTTIKDSRVKMYVCGITPYDYTHIGHARCYVTFDVLYRLLQSLGYTVIYARNITDIDDKIVRKAQELYDDAGAYERVADQFIETFHHDMARLRCLSPTYEPCVTHSILPIIGAIKQLINNGYAYEVDGNVYFDITKYEQYGKLSKQNPDEMQVGARVAVSEQKRNPLDFALWKCDDSAASFQSPWGNGRPAWHIECSVLAQECLGTLIDIHGGGMDLLFPHHENERAQSYMLHGHELARYWMHNAFVQVDQEKMSKSEGNFYTLRDLFATYDPMVVRYMLLRHHYRSPLDFSHDELKEASKAYKRLCRAFSNAEKLVNITPKTDRIQKLYECLCDDMNLPALFGLIFKHIDALQEDAYEAAAVRTLLTDVCGFTLQMPAEPETHIPEEVQALLYQREQARKQRDWQKADELREEIEKRGYNIQDRPLSELDKE